MSYGDSLDDRGLPLRKAPTSTGGTPERSEDTGQEEKAYEFVTKEECEEFDLWGQSNILQRLLAERDAAFEVAARAIRAEFAFRGHILATGEEKAIADRAIKRLLIEKKGGGKP